MKFFENRYNGPDGNQRMIFDFGLALVVGVIAIAVVLVWLNS